MSKLIMVIDDDKEILDLYDMLLSEEGYRVSTTNFAAVVGTGSGAGVTALEQVKSVNPDLLIVDLLFKGQEAGWQLIQKVRMDSTTASLPIILCSASSRRLQDLTPHLVEHNIRVVLKPFDIHELLAVVHTSLTTTTVSPPAPPLS